ncbi:MAG: sodium/pantothenate symporter [Clostridiales bacterium]|nr:sodium/pantothenate symporter [Clostridiales bacterium]
MESKQIAILGILLVYMAVNAIIGVWMSHQSAKQNASSGFIQNYFVGGRTMGGIVLAMTLIATYTSASSFLGGPGLAASWGLTQSWVAAIQIGTAFLTLGVIGKKLGLVSRRIKAVTISDYLKARYNSDAVVILCSVMLVVFFITQMIAQFKGGATLIQTVTGLSYTHALILFSVIVIAYTAFGGFKAVVITDTIQGFIMACGTFLLLFFVLRAGGGMENIIDFNAANNPGWDLIGKGEFGKEIGALRPGYLISFWVLVGVGVLGLPQTAVRSMGFKDTESLHKAMLWGTVVVGILMIGMHFAGTMALPLIGEEQLANTDSVIPYVVNKFMPTWAAGLFLAAPLAAVMSTVDSLLILASATLLKNLFVTYIAKEGVVQAVKADQSTEMTVSDSTEKKLKYGSFALTVVLGLIVFVLALNPPSILVWINLFAMGGLEATFFWPLVGGLYWKRGNAACCIASIICGVATFVFFNQVKIAPFGIHEIVLGLLVGGIAYFAVGLLNKKEPDPEMLRKCF